MREIATAVRVFLSSQNCAHPRQQFPRLDPAWLCKSSRAELKAHDAVHCLEPMTVRDDDRDVGACTN